MFFDDHMNGWGFLFGAFSNLIFLGLVVAGIVLLVRYLGRTPGRTLWTPNPRQILAERFARGEIDEEEYRRRLRVLEGD
jgi:putative membrane protein